MPRTPDNSKREAILEAVEHLFVEGRFHEVTTDDIARLAGVGKGTIYRHFVDKDALVAATIERGFDQLLATLNELAASGRGLHDRLVAICEAIAAFFASRRPWLMLLHSEEGRCARRRTIGQRRAQLADAVAAVLAAHADQLRRDPAPEIQAQLLLGMLRTRARSGLDLPVAGVVELFLEGVVHAAPVGMKGGRGR